MKKGKLVVTYKSHCEWFLFTVTQDPIKSLLRFSWFKLIPKSNCSWTSVNGVNNVVEPEHLKAMGHFYFRKGQKNISSKQIAKALSNHPFIEIEKVTENQIQLLPL